MCGEVRQFPWSSKEKVAILKEGNLDDTQVSEKDQLSIGRVSKKGGHMTISNKEKHRRYQELKEGIIADLRLIGRPATRLKWKIPGGTLSQLEKKWISPEERAAITKRSAANNGRCKVKEAAALVSTGNGHNELPTFPEFSSTWEGAVQVKWLEVYELLRRSAL